MKKKKKTAEDVAEKTGEAVGGSIRKGWGITKAFGKGVKKSITKKKRRT